MACRIVYICPGYEEGEPYWMLKSEESDRPIKGDRVMFCADDVGRTQARIIDRPWRWAFDTSCDYEAKIEVPKPESDTKPAHAAWLTARGFRQFQRDQYAEFFGVPELAERFPLPS